MRKEIKDHSLNSEAWTLLQRTRDLLFRCQDQVVSEFGLTAEQYTVLLAMKQLDDPVRPTDVGRLVGHKVNTVSMIVDRMVTIGLVERTRDLPDRRAVRLVFTSKGERAFKQAAPQVQKLIDEVFSPIPTEDRRTLIRHLKKLRDGTLKRLG